MRQVGFADAGWSRTITSASSSCWSSLRLAAPSITCSSSRSNPYKNTDARRASSRSRVGRASRRALITAWTVGGSAVCGPAAAPSTFDMSMPVVSMMKNGLPPARSAIAFACASAICPAPACRTRWIDSSLVRGSSRSSTALPLSCPQFGRSSRRSSRASARISARRGPRRPGTARRSIRSSIAGLRLCTSSNTISTG